MTKDAKVEAFAAKNRIKAPVVQKPSTVRLHDTIPVVRDSKDRPVWCPATAIALFEHHTDWRGCLRHDSFLRRDMLYRPIPGTDTGQRFETREITETDIVHAQVWCNRNGFPDAARATITDAFHAVAADNSVDLLNYWLGNLKWDRQAQLSSWLMRYLGVEESDYAVVVGRRWMISAVARALSPGCKADGCLILEGVQGGGKSSVLRILAGSEFFGGALPDLSSKDAAQFLRGKWLIELAELASLSRLSFEATKAFISRQEERYRPPYGRTEVLELRRCVFVGTTNRDDYLRDPTGNRRFWPVMTGEIDLEAIRHDRDQLWAEAVHAYNSKEVWWLTGQVAEVAAQEQAERGEDDPWVAAIQSYCDGREAVACKSILAEALEIPAERMNQRESRRVSGILRTLGYQRDGQFTSGEEKGLARYVRTG